MKTEAKLGVEGPPAKGHRGVQVTSRSRRGEWTEAPSELPEELAQRDLDCRHLSPGAIRGQFLLFQATQEW